LERKAATYAKLAAGEYDEKDADKYDVDFHAKGAMGRAGNAMAELEEEARKRDLGASIAFDYGRGGMPEWRGGAPPPPDLVRVREVPPPPPMAMMPPPMMTVPPPPVMPPPLVPPPPPSFG
jgi:U5 snRNP spliceosome subunit